MITCTGIDDYTSLNAVAELVSPGVESHEIEFGILLTDNPEGRKRYPNLKTIEKAVVMLGPSLAIHICGKTARQKAIAGIYDNILKLVGRIQVNGFVTEEELRALMGKFPGHQIITQFGHGNNDLTKLETQKLRHAILVDNSGGRGIMPDSWICPEVNSDKPIGFAGGLSPNNLLTNLEIIEKIVKNNYWWVDMESSLRDKNDLFSLKLAERAINVVMNRRIR